jgi:hypothetical protein
MSRLAHPSGWGALACGLALCASRAMAAPEPLAALGDLARVPLTVSGDVIGGTGLLSGSALATCGDALALLDDNRVLRGYTSSGVRLLARGVSWGGTQALELLRGEDVERWPEAAAAYRDAAPFTGRLDTAAAGLGALQLGLRDALLGPPAAILRAVGVQGAAQSLARSRREAALRTLGPPPAPAPAEPPTP